MKGEHSLYGLWIMELPDRPISSSILLTGAGFTHNFGAPLAEGMWSLIFNHPSVSSEKRVQLLLRNKFDFEDVYQEVVKSGNYSKEEISVISDAVMSAYEAIDGNVINWTYDESSPYPVNIYQLTELLDLFSDNGRKLGFLFTLNQDLFIERHYHSEYLTVVPGIPTHNRSDWFTHRFNQPIDRHNYSILPGPGEAESNAYKDLLDYKCCYVKLHGSFGWRSHDGALKIVIGRGKEESISEEPLLKWNFSLFETVLRMHERRLLVVGYSFRDKHVNNIIASALRECGLRLFIIDPRRPKDFRDSAKQQERGEEIWNGVEGYFPYSLLQLYPKDQTRTEEAARLQEVLFG